MTLVESSTKSKEVKFNIKTDQKGISQPNHFQNNLTFTPRPNFSGACGACRACGACGACGALEGKTFLRDRLGGFKGILDK